MTYQSFSDLTMRYGQNPVRRAKNWLRMATRFLQHLKKELRRVLQKQATMEVRVPGLKNRRGFPR